MPPNRWLVMWYIQSDLFMEQPEITPPSGAAFNQFALNPIMVM